MQFHVIDSGAWAFKGQKEKQSDKSQLLWKKKRVASSLKSILMVLKIKRVFQPEIKCFILGKKIYP